MNFDRVAGFYDHLAKSVFGSQWYQVQTVAARELNQVDQLLILGGGTGVILEELDHPQITCVEMSAKMIDQAKQRPTNATVKFVNTDFLEWKSDQKFDAIYCPFFLDCFDQKTLDKVIGKMKTLLSSNGDLHVVDFQRGSFLQQLVIWNMITFFKVTSGLKTNSLLNIPGELKKRRFKERLIRLFMKKWIFYRKYTQ